MSKIWRNRIIAGDKTFAACPSAYKAGVKALLKQDVANGVITEADYKKFTGEKYVAPAPEGDE